MRRLAIVMSVVATVLVASVIALAVVVWHQQQDIRALQRQAHASQGVSTVAMQRAFTNVGNVFRRLGCEIFLPGALSVTPPYRLECNITGKP
jgi:hypothetical protein